MDGAGAIGTGANGSEEAGTGRGGRIAGGAGDWCRWETPAEPADGDDGVARAGGARGAAGALVLCDAETGRAWARAPGTPDAAARERFLEVLAQTSNARLAAQAVRMSVRSFYALRQRDAVFADAWQRALAEAADMMAGDLISTLRGAADGKGDGGGEGAAPLARGTDPKVVLAVLKIQAELARAGGADRGREVGAGTVRHVPLGMVRGEILRRLDALDGKAEGR